MWSISSAAVKLLYFLILIQYIRTQHPTYPSQYVYIYLYSTREYTNLQEQYLRMYDKTRWPGMESYKSKQYQNVLYVRTRIQAGNRVDYSSTYAYMVN